MAEIRHVWIFNGAPWQLPSAAFSAMELAEQWIESNHLNGILTRYPLDVGVYNWALGQGLISLEDEPTPEYISRFSHANLEHFHYEDGECVAEGVGIEQREARQEWADRGALPFNIWLFNGINQPLSSAAFSSLTNAESWIQANNLSGALTLYPVNLGLYTWAVQQGFVEQAPDIEQTPEFIQQFTYAGQSRYRYNGGLRQQTYMV